MLPVTASEEIIDFIVEGKSREQIDAFHPSVQTQDRISRLPELRKAETISAEEQAELEDFLQLEHLMIMAKARARRRQSG